MNTFILVKLPWLSYPSHVNLYEFMNKPRTVGIVGYGRLGQALARSADGLEGLSLSWICDPLERRRLEAQKHYPESKISEFMRDFPDDLDLVVLATSPGPEGPPAEFFLSRSKNVISAPPLASNSTALIRRKQVAVQKRVKFAVLRHLEQYKAWVEFRTKLSEAGELSMIQADLKTFGPFSKDMEVHRSHGSWILPELAKLHKGKPVTVSALGVSAGAAEPGKKGVADMGSLLLEYDVPPAIHLSLSRVASADELRILALGHRSMMEFIGNLNGKAELRQHSRHIRLDGDTIYAAENEKPNVLVSDEIDWPKKALENALNELDTGEPPDPGLDCGLEAHIFSDKILDAAWVSLRLKGSPVSITQSDA